MPAKKNQEPSDLRYFNQSRWAARCATRGADVAQPRSVRSELRGVPEGQICPLSKLPEFAAVHESGMGTNARCGDGTVISTSVEEAVL
jgi:hypothetical protein